MNKGGIMHEEASKEVQEIVSTKNENLEIHDAYNNWKLRLLGDHIIKNHHTYVKKVLPQIKNLLEENEIINNVAVNYISEVKDHFQDLTKEMLNHIRKEERIVFPIINYLEDCKKFKEKPKTRGYGRIKDQIDVLEDEHSGAENTIKEIKNLINKFNIADDSSTKLKQIYDMLIEFEEDTQTHVHLENNILFPKAIKLEDELLNM